MYNQNIVSLKPFPCIVLFFALSFLFSNHLFAISHSVAVLPFENEMKDASLDWLSMGIPETITNDLLAIKGLVLVERVQLRKVMDEQKLQLTGAIDEKTAVQLGKLIGAQILVVGAFQKQSQIVRLTARFIDVETGGVIQTAKATGKMDDIFDLQDQIVKDLAKNLNIELKQEEIAKLSVKPTESLEAYQHFGQGTLLQAQKDYQGAVKELQFSMKADPGFTLAKQKFMEAFLSLNKGNHWIYEDKSSTLLVFRLSSLTTYRAGEMTTCDGKPCFTYISKSEGSSNSIGNFVITTIQYFVKGEDGVYQTAMEQELKTNYSYKNKWTFNPPILYYPYDLEVGKEWGVNGKVMIADRGEMKYVSKHNVTGKEKAMIPSLGEVECFVIKSRTKMGGAFSGIKIIKTEWFSPGIGIVKYEGHGTMNSKGILKEYHIEE